MDVLRSARIASLLAIFAILQVGSKLEAQTRANEAPKPISPLPAPIQAPKANRWVSSDDMIARLQAELLEDALRPTALARLYRLWNINKLLERNSAVITSLETLRQRRLAPLVRDHVNYLYAQLLLSQAKPNKASALLKRLGLINAAMLIGPFDNSAGGGHDTAFAPELQSIELQSTPGKVGEISWREIRENRSGTFDLASLIYPSSEATAYLAFSLSTPRPIRAVLRTGSIDQLKIFLNGQLVREIDTRRSANLDQDATPIDLPKGESLIMLKSSWTENEGQLLVRLTGPMGGPLKDVATRGDRASLESAQRAINARRSRTFRAPKWRYLKLADPLEKMLSNAEGTLLARLLELRADLYAILDLYDHRRLPHPPEKDLEAAIRLDPSRPMARFFYAHRVYARDPSLAREQLEAALVSDPGFAPALLKLGQLAQLGQRMLEARTYFDRALKRDPTFLPAHIARAALGFDELSEDAIAMLRLQRAPKLKRSPLGLLELARMRRALGDKGGARRDAEAALSLDQAQPMARHLAINMATIAGDTKHAIELLTQGMKLRPHDLRLGAQRAKLLAKEDRAQAIAELVRRFPQHPSVHRLHAELLLWQKEDERAVLALKKALALDPHQPELRRRIRALSGDAQRLEAQSSIDPLALLSEQVTAEEKKWGAIYLTDRSVHRLYENGKSTRFKQAIIRLHNPRLKDALRFHRVPYSPSREIVEILSAERIRPSGEIVRATRITDDGPRGKINGMYIDQRYKVIAFDDLAQGDLVHLRYRIDSIGSNIFGGFFGDIEGLQGPLPKHRVLYEITSPRDRPLYPGGVGVLKPEVDEQEKTQTLRWRYKHIEALEREPHAPPYPQMGMLVSVSTYKSWDDLGAWYARLFSEQLELDESAKAAGRKIVQGAKNNGEKIRRLYNYVVKNTRYVGIELGIHGWKPFKASEVHRRRYGDCKDKSTLLAALLKDNGVDATITLVRTADRGLLPKDHATMWAFNHAITYVPSEDLFLDPTAEFSGSTELPHLDQGAMALIVHSNGQTKLTKLPIAEAKANLNSSAYTATLQRSGRLELTGKERFFGARASSLRQEYEALEKRKPLLERQLGQIFEGVRVGALEFSDLSDLEAPVEYSYTATIERYGALEPGRLTLPVALFQHQVAGAYSTLAERKLDLYISHPWSTQNVISYHLPKGAKLASLPESIEIDTPHISLVQKIKRTPDGFETNDTVTLKSRKVPAQAYAQFREACLKIDRAMTRKVVITW